MKLYEITMGSETVWVAGTDPISALHFAETDGIIEMSSAEEGDDIKEVPREKWKDLFITDENGNKEKSFEEELAIVADQPYFTIVASTLGL